MIFSFQALTQNTLHLKTSEVVATLKFDSHHITIKHKITFYVFTPTFFMHGILIL
jgi:hypothetical protein